MRRKIVHRPERDRAVFAVLRSIRGVKPAEVAARSGVSEATIRNWRRPVADGGTRYPQFWTLNQVAKSFGMEFKLVERSDSADARQSEARLNS